MKIELEQHDIEAIVQGVAQLLMPYLSCNGKCAADDEIFDKEGLSKYLRLSKSAIDKMVSNKQIPHYKLTPRQSGSVRFRKSAIDKWLSKTNIPDINPLSTGLRADDCQSMKPRKIA